MHLIEFTWVNYLAYCSHKDIPITVVRLYFDSYSRQKARVSWNNIMSEYLSVSNGVKQGGVLSSMLFILYIDPLLQKLKQSGVAAILMVILWESCRMLMTLLLFVRVF